MACLAACHRAQKVNILYETTNYCRVVRVDKSSPIRDIPCPRLMGNFGKRAGVNAMTEIGTLLRIHMIT